MIAGWLARSLGLATTKIVEPTHDPSGRPVVMERCDEPHVRIDGFAAVADRATPVIELPPSFESAGIGVILSPQALASAELAIVLDMPRKEMRRVRSRDLPSEAAAPGGTFEVEHTVLCSRPGPVFANSRLTATAIVDGVSTVLEVDTGAFGTPFFLAADTEVGRKVLARPDRIGETGLSAAGKLDVVTARDVPVRVGSQDRRTNVTVMPGTRDAACGVEGRLGLEWLRACVFTIGHRVVVALARHEDVRLRPEVRGLIQRAGTEADLRVSRRVEEEARAALRAESTAHVRGRRVPLEAALLDELEVRPVDGRVGADVTVPAATHRAVAIRDAGRRAA